MQARVLGWLGAGLLPLALLAACAGNDTPSTSDSTTVARTVAPRSEPETTTAESTQLVTEPVTDPTTPVTEPTTIPPTEVTTVPPTEATTIPPTEPPTTAPAGPPTIPARGATRILVLNAGYKDGGAGATADGLASLGYQMLKPANAIEERKQSAVYFKEGWEAVARQIADYAGISQDLVAPLPDSPITDPQPDAFDVAVLLGRDRR